MIETTFYHNTTRRYTVAFGSIFNGITIDRQNKAGEVVDSIPVPLIYGDKEKFVRRAVELSSISPDEPKVKETLPAMGFELLNFVYAPMRKTNTMERITDASGNQGKFMYNRVPYDFNFALYVATRRTDDALRIVEQILPYFTPELNLRIRELQDFPDIITDVPVVLLDATFDNESQGTFEDRRLIQWQLSFTMKGYLYTNVRDVKLIKKTIVDLSDSQINSFYEGYMSQVDPLNAGQGDEHQIIEEITTDHRDKYIWQVNSGSNLQVSMA